MGWHRWRLLHGVGERGHGGRRVVPVLDRGRRPDGRLEHVLGRRWRVRVVAVGVSSVVHVGHARGGVGG